MAITDQQSHVIAGMATAADEQAEREATRKGCGALSQVEFIDLREQRIDPELFRSDSRGPDVPLQLCAAGSAEQFACRSRWLIRAKCCSAMSCRCCSARSWSSRWRRLRQISDLLKRTEQSQRVLEQATEAFTLQVGKDEVESEETISGDRLTRDIDGESGRSTGGNDHLHRARTARERHSHRSARRRSGGEVPHRRRVAARDAADREGMAFDDAVAHQGDERSGHRRAARAAGRPLPREVQGAIHRLARLDHAGEPRRRRCASRTR